MATAKRLTVCFYRTAGGHEPVREWLLPLSGEDKKVIGTDINRRIRLADRDANVPTTRERLMGGSLGYIARMHRPRDLLCRRRQVDPSQRIHQENTTNAAGRAGKGIAADEGA